MGFPVLTFFKCHSQNITANRLIVKYVNQRITTPIPISCNDFEKTFAKNQVYEKTIEDSVALIPFEKIFEEVKYIKGDTSIDVRSKFYVYFLGDNKPKVICMNKFNDILIDGLLIANNRKLIGLLRSFLE